MRPREALTLVGLRRARPDSRLERCHTVDDLRAYAARRLPRAIFDYLDGGADEETSLAANREAFRRRRFMPACLVDVSQVDTSTTLFDQRVAFPLLLAPTGYTRLVHPDGELAVARAARAASVPYALSTVASTSVEDVAASGHDNLWFQLYIWRDRDLTWELVRRAWDAGFRALELTVDTAVSGFRCRDVRNGLSIPPKPTLRTLAGIAARPSYWLSALRAPGLELANLPRTATGAAATIADIGSLFDATVSWDDVRDLRERWPGRLLLKGLVGPEDARRAVYLGLDGIHLSNHGGRQLDRAAVPVDLVPRLRAALGEDAVLVVDSGIRHGADLAVALALGADAGAIGRPYLYGLAAAGEAGVARALRILREQFVRTLQLLGVTSLARMRDDGDTFLADA